MEVLKFIEGGLSVEAICSCDVAVQWAIETRTVGLVGGCCPRNEILLMELHVRKNVGIYQHKC